MNFSSSAIVKALDGFVAAAFPTSCPLCHNDLGWPTALGICHKCGHAIQPWSGPVCAVCGLPLASDEAFGGVCAGCRRGEHRFDIARSYGIYNFPLRNLILRLKFSGGERGGRALGGLLAPLAMSFEIAGPLIIPVPLHRSRERERGYNQSYILAQGLYSRLKRKTTVAAPLDGILIRKRSTPPQTGLRRAARLENVRGAFAVEAPESIQGRGVILVDDVMTTGATASACAAALKRAGAQKVAVLTVARATPLFPDMPSLPWMVDGALATRT